MEGLKEKREKVEKGGGEEKERLRREGRNPRNVFGPEAPVTTEKPLRLIRVPLAQSRWGGATKPAAGGKKQEEGKL